jgi:hypothetical protein
MLASTTLVIDACSAFPMNPMVKAPIHAATTTLTATVTAMSMIVAITGLSAFAFFLNFPQFIFFFNTPCVSQKSLILHSFKYCELRDCIQHVLFK